MNWIVSINLKGDIDHDLEADQFRNHHIAKGTNSKTSTEDIGTGVTTSLSGKQKEKAGSKATGKLESPNGGGHKSSLFGGNPF